MIRALALIVAAGACAVLWPYLSRALDAALEWADTAFERRRSNRLKDAPLAFTLLLPALAVLGVFGLFPIVFSLYISLFDLRRGIGPFTGLGNYAKALAAPDFWRSLAVTVYFAAGAVPLAMALSFIAASMLFHVSRARGLFRTMYFLPYVTSVVAAATVWKAMLHPQIGFVNTLLGWLGVNSHNYPQWLLEPRGVLNLLTDGAVPPTVGPSLALCCVILFEIWHSSGFMIVIFLAGLTTIPRELDESARLDGAGWIRRTWHITLPLLSPTVFFLTIVSTARAFQAFNSFYALTGDGQGPLNTTRNMTVYIYSSFYIRGREGYGAAVATLLSIAIIALTVAQWRVARHRVHYET